MIKKIFVCLFLALFSASMSGCVALVAGAVGGAGTAVWLSGKLSQEFDVTMEKAIQAVRSGLKSINMTVSKETFKDNVAQILSTYPGSKPVWIDLHKISSKRTKISVRVGPISEQPACRDIMDAIKKYL